MRPSKDITHLKDKGQGMTCMHCRQQPATIRVSVANTYNLCLCDECASLPDERLIPAALWAA